MEMEIETRKGPGKKTFILLKLNVYESNFLTLLSWKLHRNMKT
jgi:hypothetical protein